MKIFSQSIQNETPELRDSFAKPTIYGKKKKGTGLFVAFFPVFPYDKKFVACISTNDVWTSADGQVDRIGCVYGEVRKNETKKDAVVRLLEKVCGIIVDADKNFVFDDYMVSPTDTAIVALCKVELMPTEYTQSAPMDENMKPVFLSLSQKNTLSVTDLMSKHLLSNYT